MLRIVIFFWIGSRSPSPATHPHTNFIITAVVRPRTWRTRCFNICLNDKLIWLKLHLFLDARPVSVESYESHRKPHDARWKSYEVNRKTYGIIRKFYKIIWNPYDIQKYARMYYNIMLHVTTSVVISLRLSLSVSLSLSLYIYLSCPAPTSELYYHSCSLSSETKHNGICFN